MRLLSVLLATGLATSGAVAAEEPAGRPGVALGARSTVNVAAGSVLRTRPTVAAPVVTIVDETTPGELVEERSGWRRVRIGTTTGWIAPEGLDRGARGPAPEIDTVRRERALALLPEGSIRSDAGGLALHAPGSEAARLERWSRVAERTLESWPVRLGIAVEGARGIELDGATIVFAPGHETPDDPADAPGSAGGGVALIRLGERSDDQLEALLVHELSHLASERSFPASLPIWFEEGIAEWLAREPLANDGYSLPGMLRGEVTAERERGGRTVEFTGPLADLVRLAREAKTGTLPELDLWTAIPEATFSAPEDRGTNYALAGSFVRFLFEADPNRAAVVRETLAGAARGELGDQEVASELDRRLGDVGELDRAFRAWLIEESDRETAQAAP